MTWIKLDTNLFRNPKILEAGKDGVMMYVAGLCYCGENLTDGHIPNKAIRIIGGDADVDDPDATAEVLVGVGLWERNGSGFTVHNYLEWQRSAEEVEELSAKRAAAGRAGGIRSVASRREAKEAKLEASAQANGKQMGSKPPSKIEADTDTEKREKESSLRSPKKVECPPDDFSLTTQDYEWAEGKFGAARVACDFLAESMVDWANSKGERRKDWRATWRGFVRKEFKDRAIPVATNGKMNGKAKGVASVDEETWKRNYRERYRLQGVEISDENLEFSWNNYISGRMRQ